VESIDCLRNDFLRSIFFLNDVEEEEDKEGMVVEEEDEEGMVEEEDEEGMVVEEEGTVESNRVD
jgi:hypothetical protein